MKTIAMAEIKLTEQEIEAAVRVLRSGALRQGVECEAFEQSFSEKTGARHAVTCASGSAALHLAYLSFLKPGDEVLVPSFTFIATGSMVSMSGGKPVFCDVSKKSFLLDLADAEKKITEKTKAISPVHLFGNPCDIDAVTSFAKRHNLYIIWDAAQAHGAEYKGKDVGFYGDFTCYSFYPSKNMFVGEGGMTCTNNEEFAHRLKFLKTHGQTGKYLHTMQGLNYRMTDVEAAIGREQLKRLDEMLTIRRRNVHIFNEGLREVEGIYPQEATPDSEHACHQYCVVVNRELFGCDRDILAKKLAEKGVSTGVHYPRGMHQQPVFEKLYGTMNLENTEYLTRNILALPVHHGLSEEDAKYIVESIQDIHG